MRMALVFEGAKRMFTRDRDFYRIFLKLLLTLMLEQAIVLSVNLVDNFMLGNYAEEALSGVAAVNQIQFVLQQVINGVTGAMIILGAQYWGQKRMGEIRKLSAIAMRVAIGFAVVLLAAVSLFPAQSLAIFTNDAKISEEGIRYLNIVRISYPFFAMSAVMTATMRVVERVRIALEVSLVALLVNCSINYCLIFGKFGCPEMGVEGAAIGTLAARIVEWLILIWYVHAHDDAVCMRPRDYVQTDRALSGDYARVAAPVILTSAVWGVSNALQTVILGHMDKTAIAAQSISSNVFLLLKAASVGASSAASILIGKTIGSNRGIQKIREYTRTLQVLFVGIGLILGLALFALREPILNVYNNISPETRSLANVYMMIQSAVLVTMSYQMPTNGGIIRGGGDTKYAMLLDVISIWGIVLPASYLAAFVFGANPVTVILLLNSDQAFKCIPAFIRANGYKWVKKLTR